MKIAIIAWGSVVWRPADLPFSESDPEWHKDGPVLPLEFSRISKDARLTLVLDDTGTKLPTLHRQSDRSCLTDTVADLRDRECTLIKNIGYVNTDGKATSLTKYPVQFNAHDTVRAWLGNTQLYDAAVWTALPSNFNAQRGQFSNDAATDYLRALPEVVRKNAIDYIRKAPDQITTALRQHLSKAKLI